MANLRFWSLRQVGEVSARERVRDRRGREKEGEMQPSSALLS